MTDEIDQDVREATEAFKRNALVIIRVLAHQDGEEAEYNSNYLDQMFVQAFARMKAAGREQGLREAMGVVENLPWDESRVGNANFDDTKEYAVKAITALIGG